MAFSDPEFKFLRDVLDAQMKDLRSHGVGSSKKQAEPISEEEENRLWELGLLGDLNAQTLLHGYNGMDVWSVFCITQWGGASEPSS